MRVKAELHKSIQGMKPVLEECWFLSEEVEHYSLEQMREVYAGVMGYQTERCIRLYSSHELTPNQMYEIRCGVEDGLSYEEVLAYADKHLNWRIMRHIRESMTAAKGGGASFGSAAECLRKALFTPVGSKEGDGR